MIDGVQQAVPERQGQLHAGGRRPPDGALDRGRGRQPARHGRHRPAGPREAVRAAGRAEADQLRAERRSRQLRAGLGRPRHVQRQALRARLQGGQQVDRLVQRPRLQETPASSRRRRGRSCVGDAKTIKASGTPAYSIGGADGWTLTDLFENIYLRQAGAAKYDQLSAHKIKWTDPSVTRRAADDGAGPRRHAEHRRRHVAARCRPTSRPRSTTSFQTPPKAAMVIEGDFVPGGSRTDEGEAGRRTSTSFPFPSIDGSRPSRRGSAATRSSRSRTRRRSQAFVKFLATPDAAEIWAKRGGFAHRQQEHARERLPGRRSRGDGDARSRRRRRSPSTCPTSSRPRSARPPARASGASSRTSSQNPIDVTGIQQQLEARPRRRTRTGSRRLSRCSDHGGAARRGRLRRSPAGRAGAPLPRRARSSSLPALRPARRLDRLPDDLHDRPQLLRARRGSALRRDRQLQDAVHDLDARRPRSRTT